MRLIDGLYDEFNSGGHPFVSVRRLVVFVSDPDSATLPGGADTRHGPERFPADAAATEPDPRTA